MGMIRICDRSFPAMRVYTPEGVYVQLKQVATQCLSKVKLAGSKGQIQLPAILESYEADLIRDNGKEGAIAFISERLPPALVSKHKKLFDTA